MRGDAVAPDPLSLPFSGGDLQRVLCKELAKALEEPPSQAAADRRRRKQAAARRRRRVRTLWFIPEELLGFVRGQLGWEAGTALKKRLAGLKEQDDEDLRERLHDEGMTDAERVVKEARDVLDRLKPQTAVLALDAGERLQPEDVELLGDLAGACPRICESGSRSRRTPRRTSRSTRRSSVASASWDRDIWTRSR